MKYRVLAAIGLFAWLMAAGYAGADPSPATAITHISVECVADLPPYVMRDARGHADGFSIDLLKAVARVENLEPDIRIVPRNSIARDLASGRIDVLPRVTFSPQRAKLFDFTPPYTISYITTFVRRGDARFMSPGGLRDKKAIVMGGSATADYLQQIDLTHHIQSAKSLKAAFELLARGQGDFVVAPKLSGLLVLRRLGTADVVPYGPNLEPYGYGYSFAVRKGELALLDRLDQGLALVQASGEFNRIYNKWFGPIIPHPDRVSGRLFRELLLFVVIGALVFLAAMLWIRMLRRQVHLRTVELKRKSDQMDRLIQNLSVAVVVRGPDGRVIQSNGLANKLFGRIEQGMSDMPLEDAPWQLVRPDYTLLPLDEHPVNQVLHSRQAVSNMVIGLLCCDNEETVWVVVNAMPDFDSGGELMQVIVTYSDITVQKKAEERLLQFSEVVEQAIEGIVITDRKGIIEYVNPAFTEITGYDTEEIIGNTPAMLKSGKQDDAFYRKMWDTISEGHAWSGKLIDRRKDGSFYPTLMSIAPIRDANGQLTHYAGIQLDITEQEKMEDQLRQSQKIEALGILVGGIAHDFNNILAGMLGNLYFIKRAVKDMPNEAVKVQRIEALGFRAADMITQMLTFARKGTVEKHRIDLGPFLKEALKMAKVTIPENILIEHDIQAAPIPVEVDATQLQQVLLNLLNNARDALEASPSPRILITLEKTSADVDLLREKPEFAGAELAHLCIRDNGAGIAAEDLDKVFEPFFTTKAVGKGTGLGLSMVYGAVQSHGGVIHIDTSPGQGTAMHLYFPLQTDKTEVEVAGGDTMREYRGNGQTILLADDEKGLLNIQVDLFKSLGYQVIAAGDGEEAMRQFDAHADAVELAVLDVVMPKANGTDVARYLWESRPGLPIVFMTGYDMALFGELKRENESVHLIRKPCSLTEIGRVVHDLLTAPAGRPIRPKA